jgi:hypothetical protein
MEGSLVAYKVFTNGSVLQASELNENLMQQSTAVFSNAAARTAAITSPVEGQLTYLEDTNQYASWDGSSWVSPFGLTFLASTSFTSTSSVDVDNVFSSEFDSYIINVATTSNSAFDAQIQLRASGTTAVGNYGQTVLAASGTSTTVSNAGNLTASQIGRIASSGGAIQLVLNNPFLAQRTYGLSNAIDSDRVLHSIGIAHTLSSSYTGFRLTLNNSTGSVRVYGLRK